MIRLLFLPLLLFSAVSAEVCTGDLVWNDNATVCIPTCTAHFYPDGELCPTRKIGRCVCSEGLIKLEDTNDKCVEAGSKECMQATHKYMDNAATQFQFSKEPTSVTLNSGESTTLTCIVSNKYTIQYIWYKLDELPQGDATAAKNLYMTGTSELVFKEITADQAGYYQCKAVASSDFLMISAVGRVRVHHFTTEDTDITEERVVLYNPIVELKCSTINADPMPEIKWYFKDEAIDFSDVHYLQNSNKESSTYGSLYIMNVQSSHEGKYACKGKSSEFSKTVELAQRTVLLTGSQNTVSGTPKVMETANYGSFVKIGTEGTLYCAGYGFPAPEIKWYKVAAIGEEQPEISGCTESACVQEGGRKMTIYNLNSDNFGDYQCVVENTYDLVTKILSMSRAPDSYDVTFDSISAPVNVEPNRYVSFTLTCVVDTSQNAEIYMGWYQNTQGIADKGDRIRINSSVRDGKSVQELVFDFPTNDDHGVFQCLAYNSKNFKQATTDVFVYMSGPDPEDNNSTSYDVDSDFAAEMYDPDSDKEYKYYAEEKTAAEAEAICQDWKADAHLSTILDYQENDSVFNLIMANKNATNNTKAWIGLTDEAKEGVWLWLSSEVSDKFCFWWKNHPDNSEEDRDYAYMDAAKSGHWLDAGKDTTLPFICKYYNGTCIDLENQTELDIDFKSYTKKQLSSRVSIYDTASIGCGGSNADLTCAPSGKWVLKEGSVCGKIDAVTGKDNSGSSLTYQPAVLVLLILAYLLT